MAAKNFDLDDRDRSAQLREILHDTGEDINATLKLIALVGTAPGGQAQMLGDYVWGLWERRFGWRANNEAQIGWLVWHCGKACEEFGLDVTLRAVRALTRKARLTTALEQSKGPRRRFAMPTLYELVRWALFSVQDCFQLPPRDGSTLLGLQYDSIYSQRDRCELYAAALRRGRRAS